VEDSADCSDFDTDTDTDIDGGGLLPTVSSLTASRDDPAGE
jgi:hypothetical protein